MDFLPEQHDCPVDAQHPTGRAGRACDLQITLSSDKVGDFVWTWYSECLLTDRVLHLFEKAEIRGFQTKPVTVTGVKRGLVKNVPRLHELVVTGWGGEIRNESGIKVVERCPGCGRTVYGAVLDWTKAIDESRWDGSDLFMLWPLPKFIFVTENVGRLIAEKDLKGSKATPLRKMTRDVDGCMAGRLDEYFSPEVARRRQRDILL